MEKYSEILSDETLHELLDNAGLEKVPPLYYSFSDYKYKNTPKERNISGIRELDYLLKGFEVGGVTIWTGVTNSGKTTVMTYLIKKMIENGEKVFFFNGEQTRDDFKNNLYKQFATKKDIVEKQYKDTCIFDYFVSDEFASKLANKYNRQIYLYNNEAPRDIDHIIYAMNEVRNKGVKVFIIDNFMQIDLQSTDIFQEQSDIIEKIRSFAVNNEVHVHLVAHPRKIERGQVRLDIFDISGSMNMANKAYNVISIMRVDRVDKQSKEYKTLSSQLLECRYNIEDTNTILEILKTKGEGNGMIGLKFDKLTRSFEEATRLTYADCEKLKTQGGNPF